MNLLQPAWLWLLLGVVPLALLAVLGNGLTRAALRRFYGSARATPWAGSVRRGRSVLRAGVLLVAFASLAVALSRPAHSPEPRPVQRPAREVVFVVDVSRSMLARDLRPNRLERAKLAVADAMETVRGERIGIVVFAGSASVKSPLTTDVGFARLALDSLSPDSVGRGGTAIGEGIRAALELFGIDSENPEPAHDSLVARDIVLITDGEDHESDPLGAAEKAAAAGVRIITIGLGSELTGATIPAEDGVTQQVYRGEPVVTRQVTGVLQAIADTTPGGVFLNVGTGSIEMDRVYARLMRDRSQTRTDSTPALRWSESFQLFLAVGLVCLCVEPLLGLSLKRRRNA
ncbi:MAG: VWA domain-containing protein [Phycisphaeraceae bacterium]|nr:VWA domain-containing protein [Phycisphaeraceae bacterium]